MITNKIWKPKDLFHKHPWDYWLLGLLIFFYPIGVWLIPSGGSSVFNILGVGGFVVLIIRRTWPCNCQENLVLLTLLLYLSVTFLSWWINGMENEGFKLLRRQMLFILAVFGMAWLAWRRPSAGFFWWGVVTASILIGLTGLYIFSLEKNFRSGIFLVTQVNPIVFGQLAVVLFALTAASFHYFHRLKPWSVIFPAAGANLSLIAAIGSSTRGAWLALPAVIILIFWHYHKSLLKNTGKILAGFLIFIILFFMYSGWNTVHDRIGQAVSDVQSYLKDPEKRTSSSAVRLNMWRAAFESGKKAPLFGPGKDEYQRTLKSGVKAGDFIKKAGTHHFPHSEYATAFGYHGIAGLLSFILILLVPGRIFWKRLLSPAHQEIKTIPLAGLLVVISFAMFSLTDSPFEQRTTIMFYALMVIIPLTLNTKSIQSPQKPGNTLITNGKI